MSTSTRKTVAWTVMAWVVALWVLVVFFFDGILSKVAEEQLIKDVASATHGEYQLSFSSFQLHLGTLNAAGMDMRRIAYRTDEHGTTLRDLGINSVKVTGIRWWSVLFGKPIQLWALRTNEPRVYLCDFAQDRSRWKLLPPYVPATSPLRNVLISFDSVLVPNVWVYGQRGTADENAGVLSFSSRNLLYDSKSNAPLQLTYKDFELHAPWIEYSDSSVSYSVRGLNAISSDPLLSADTFSFSNGSTHIRGSGVWGNGINFVQLLAGKGISAHRFQAATWAVALTAGTDTAATQPPTNLPWQDRLARSANFPIKIDTLLLGCGALDLRFANSSSFAANGLDLRTIGFDFDTGGISDRPGFAPIFSLAAGDARYTSQNLALATIDFRGAIQDSAISAGSISYSSVPGSAARNAPEQIDDLSADGIGFRELLAGTEISARTLRSRRWYVSGLPVSSNSKKPKRAVATIETMQQNIAKWAAIPIRIGRIDLTGGSVHIMGASSPTILATGAVIEAVQFYMDTSHSASRQLLFSKDVSIAAQKFHFADKDSRDIVELAHARTHLSGRSVSASSASYTTRASFEPNLNYTTYHTTDLDLTGIDFAGLLDNKRIALSTLRAGSWESDRSSDTITQPPNSTAPEQSVSSSGWKKPIFIANVELPNGTVIFRERDTTPGGFSPTLQSKVTNLEVTQFRFLPPKGKRPRLAFDQVRCVIPNFTYTPFHGFYTADVRNLNANLKDSLITMDSLAYEPKYSEDEFAALHKYARGRTDFRLAGVKVIGIDARRMINGGGVVIDKFIAPTVWVDYYKDTRVPEDPNPGPAEMPNQIVRSLKIPFTVNSLVLEKGHIQIREHTVSGVPPGNFTFNSVSVAVEPLRSIRQVHLWIRRRGSL